MECKCNDKKRALRHVQGNTLSLAIALQAKETTFVDGVKQVTVSDYVPEHGDEITVVLESDRKKRYEYTGYKVSVQGNMVTMQDDGTLPVGTYGVEVDIVEAAQGVHRRFYQETALVIVKATKDAISEQGVEFDTTLYSLDAMLQLGLRGSDGKTAYQTWLDQGHEGSEDDFLDWLRTGALLLQETGQNTEAVMSQKATTDAIEAVRTELNAKQFEAGVMTFDDVPTEDSENLLRSGAVYDSEELLRQADARIENKIDTLIDGQSAIVRTIGGYKLYKDGFFYAAASYKTVIYDVTPFVGKRVSVTATNANQSVEYMLVKDHTTMIDTTNTTYVTEEYKDDFAANNLLVKGSATSGSSSNQHTATIILTDEIVTEHVADGGSVYLIVTLWHTLTATPLLLVDGIDDRLARDKVPTKDSERLVESGGVYAALYGGDEISYVDGTTIVSPVARLINGNMVNKANSNHSMWLFTNNNYVHVRAKVGSNGNLNDGMCAIAFYVGGEWTVINSSYIIYSATALTWFEADVPEGCTRIAVCSRKAGTVEIELTQAAGYDGIEDRVEDLEALAPTIESTALAVVGGSIDETIDGTVLVSKKKAYLQGNLTNKSSNSYSRWNISNNGYTHIRAYVGVNTTLTNGICMVAFWNGREYTVPEGFIKYSSTSMTWYEADVPEDCKTIVVSHRNSAGTPKIELTKTEVVEPITDRVATLEKRLDNEGNDSNSRVRDEDCLMLRNHIKTNWPYFFAAPGTTDSYDAMPYLDMKIKNVPEGKHFLFITDSHWQDNPAKNSIYIASYVSKRLGGCTVLFGGDCLNSASNKYLAAKAFSNFTDEFYAAFGDNGLWVQGNHDSNKLGTGLIDDTEVYKRTVARIAHKVTFDEEGIESIQNIGLTDEQLANAEAWMKLHYHYDDVMNRVRYIVYESGCAGVTLHDLVRSGTSYMLPLLYRWLSRTLLSTPTDYDIVIAGHMLRENSTSYTNYKTSGNNTDARNLIRLVRTFVMKGTITVNMRAVNTTNGTAFARALCGTSASRTFDFTNSHHEGRLLMISGHWHSDTAFTCKYYENIGGVEGRNGVDVQQYSSEDDHDNSVLHFTTACDTTFNDRNNGYPSRPSTTGQVSEVLFDVVTITDDDRVVCTRFGYGEDREFYLMQYGQNDEDESSTSSDDSESSDDIIDEIING